MKFLKNIQIKGLALLSALLLWIFVVGVENYVYLLPMELSVKVINLGQNVSIANKLAKVKVRFKTQGNNDANVNSNEFELFVDAANLSEGNYGLEVNYLSKNPKVTIVAVEPQKIALSLEAITSKEIKLKTEVTGKPSKDYDLKDLKLSQDKIKISGAASVLSKISEMVIKITLDGTEMADFSRKIAPEAPAEWNLSGKTINFDPAVIQADVQVRKTDKKIDSGLDFGLKPNLNDENASSNLKKKTLMAKIIKNGGDFNFKELIPQNILVTVEGEEKEVSGLNSDDVILKLSLGKVINGIYNVDIKDIVLPEGKNLKIIEFSPERVLVKF